MTASNLPLPLWVSSLMRLVAADENQILQRLYERDECLLQDLQALQATRDDLLQQFVRLDDVEARWRALNEIINQIVRSFYLDLNGDGATDWDGDVDYFVRLIADLKASITSCEELTAGIIRYNDIQDLLRPEVQRLNQVEDLDRLIREKLRYIYARWDVDPSDDILSVGGNLPLAAWDAGIIGSPGAPSTDLLTVTVEPVWGSSPASLTPIQAAASFNGVLAGEAFNPGQDPEFLSVIAGTPPYGDTFTVDVGKAFNATPALSKVLLLRLGWASTPNALDRVNVTVAGLSQVVTVSNIEIPEVGLVDPIQAAVGRVVSFRIHGTDQSIEQL